MQNKPLFTPEDVKQMTKNMIDFGKSAVEASKAFEIKLIEVEKREFITHKTKLRKPKPMFTFQKFESIKKALIKIMQKLK